jgi:hypothetical protein
LAFSTQRLPLSAKNKTNQLAGSYPHLKISCGKAY